MIKILEYHQNDSVFYASKAGEGNGLSWDLPVEILTFRTIFKIPIFKDKIRFTVVRLFLLKDKISRPG